MGCAAKRSPNSDPALGQMRVQGVASRMADREWMKDAGGGVAFLDVVTFDGLPVGLEADAFMAAVVSDWFTYAGRGNASAPSRMS